MNSVSGIIIALVWVFVMCLFFSNCTRAATGSISGFCVDLDSCEISIYQNGKTVIANCLLEPCK